MSSSNGIGQWLAQLWHLSDDVDVTVAKVGLLAGVLLLGLRLLAAQVYLLVIPLATVVGSGLFLLVRKRRATHTVVPTISAPTAGFLPALVVAGLAGLLVLIRVSGGRTIPVYLLTGAIGSLVLAQILFLSDREFEPGAVLLQVLGVGVVVRLSALFATPGFVGVDIWTHVPVFVGGIVETGSLSALGGSKYVLAPFYHAIGGVATHFFGAPRSAVYLTIGLLVPLSALFVYATAVQFVPARVAVLATALYVFADQFIRWGLHVIPTSLGIVFFLGALYWVTKLLLTDAEWWSVAGLFVFSFAMVFTHQLSTAILLVFLGVATAAAFLARSFDRRRSAAGSLRSASALGLVFAVTTVVTVVSWANTPWTGGSFLWRMLATLRAILGEQFGFLNLASSGSAEGGSTASTTPTLVEQLIPLLDVFGFTVLLAVTILGALVMIGWDEPVDVTLVHLATAAVLFVAVFGLSIFGVRGLLPGRWIVFMYAPMAVIGAIGLYYLSTNASRRALFAVVVLVALAYPSAMAVNHSAAKDAPVFDDEYTRFSYTQAEIAAVDTIGQHYVLPEDAVLETDHPYRTLYDRVGGFESRILVMGQSAPTERNPVVYRAYQRTGPSTFHEAGAPPRSSTTRGFAPTSVCPATRDHVYANDQVRLCLPGRGSPEVSP